MAMDERFSVDMDVDNQQVTNESSRLITVAEGSIYVEFAVIGVQIPIGRVTQRRACPMNPRIPLFENFVKEVDWVPGRGEFRGHEKDTSRSRCIGDPSSDSDANSLLQKQITESAVCCQNTDAKTYWPDYGGWG